MPDGSWRCLEHRRFENVPEMEAYQRKAVELSLRDFKKSIVKLGYWDKKISDLTRKEALRLIATAARGYEQKICEVFDREGAHGENIPGILNQACPECGGREWIDAKRSKQNKKLVGAGCKGCSRIVWLNDHERHHYGLD